MLAAIPNLSARALAAPLVTLLVESELHLVKEEFNPTQQTTVAELAAIEADFTGYAAAELTAWSAPFSEADGGATILAPTKVFATASPYTVGNTIYGWYITLAAGGLVACGTFDEGFDCSGAGDALPLTVAIQLFLAEKFGVQVDVTP